MKDEAAIFVRDWHRQHREMGLCAAISTTRAWCCRPAGHTGVHGSPRVPNPDLPVGTTNPTWVDWET